MEIFSNQDCMLGMAAMDAESADVVVTSPPYNLGTKYSTYKDDMSWEDYMQWMRRWAVAVNRVLSSQGSLFIVLGGVPSNYWAPFHIAQVIGDCGGFHLQNVIHWIKSITVKDKSIGHFKPINSPRFINDCHEYVFHFTKTGKIPLDRLAVGVPYQDKGNLTRGNRGRRGDIRCRGNNWFIPYETIQNRNKNRPHPATFPVRLAEWCILLSGVEHCRLVMDPFGGIGTTVVAALNLGVDSISFEIDPQYCEEARKRIARHKQKPLVNP